MQSGCLGEMLHLWCQTAIAAFMLGVNCSISGVGMCKAWVSGTGTAVWGGGEGKGFPTGISHGISILFYKCKS